MNISQILNRDNTSFSDLTYMKNFYKVSSFTMISRKKGDKKQGKPPTFSHLYCVRLVSGLRTLKKCK